MVAENDVSEGIVKLLNARLSKKYPFLSVTHLTKIFVAPTVGVQGGKLKLIMQTAEQDIVVAFKEPLDFSKILEDEDKSPVVSFSKRFTGGKLIIPLVIFEIKFEGVNTHQIRQYSEEGRLISHIFPFCSYNLVLIDAQDIKERSVDKVYMAGKYFRNCLYFVDFNRKGGYKKIAKNLYNLVEKHIKYLKENENFYHLKSLLRAQRKHRR